jgi:hypothetical protein
LKLLNAVGEAGLASVAIFSMYSFSLHLLPEPFNGLVLAGGAGLLAATALVAQGRGKKSGPVGIVGALPGVPLARPGKSTGPTGAPDEEERLLRRYDRAFTEMLARQSAKSRSYILEQMKPMVYQLSPDIKAWTGDTRIRMHLLLKELAKDLDDPSSARQSLDLLVLILSKGGSSAVEMARPMFREKIQAMYDRSHHQDDRLLPRLLLILDDYDPKAVETLTKDAIYVWGDDRFRAASEFLGLETLRERGLRSRLKGVLGGEIARAGNDGDVTALCRAMELYQAVR